MRLYTECGCVSCGFAFSPHLPMRTFSLRKKLVACIHFISFFCFLSHPSMNQITISATASGRIPLRRNILVLNPTGFVSNLVSASPAEFCQHVLQLRPTPSAFNIEVFINLLYHRYQNVQELDSSKNSRSMTISVCQLIQVCSECCLFTVRI